MTVEELRLYYANLLISQYKDKPRAFETIKSLIDMTIQDLLPLSVKDTFNVDTAIGSQLDILGIYQGATRFSFGPNGPFTLTDDEFRKLLRLAIVKNSTDSSLKTISDLLFDHFTNEIQIFDNGDMTLQYILAVNSDNLFYAFVNQGFLPRPMGVQITTVFSVLDMTNIFGFGTYDSPMGYHIKYFSDYDIKGDTTSPGINNSNFLTYNYNIA